MSQNKVVVFARKLGPTFSQIKLQDVLSVLTVLVVTCLIAGIFQIIYLGWPYNEYISAIANDIPRVRPDAIKIQMNFGIHYFGDLLQPLDWAKLANPWTYDPKYLAQYPPLAVYLLKPFTLFPYRVAAVLYLSLMILSSAIGSWLITKHLNRSNQVLLWIILGVSSVPFLMAFDRGNSVGYLFFLFCVFVYGVTKDKRNITWVSLTLMISIKIYPVMLLLVLLKLKRFKEFAYSIFASLLVAVILFAITPGNFIHTVKQFVTANTSGFGLQGGMQMRAFAQLFRQFIDAPDAILQSWELADTANTIFSFLRIGILATSVLIVLLKPRLKFSGLLLLSCIAMTTLNSSQIGYNWFWAPAFVIWLLAEKSIKIGTNDVFPTLQIWRTEKYSLIAAVGFCILSLPIGLHMPGSNTPLTPYIGIFTSFVSIVYLLFSDIGIKPKQRKQLSVN